jgi:hypothetical protein
MNSLTHKLVMTLLVHDESDSVRENAVFHSRRDVDVLVVTMAAGAVPIQAVAV